MTGQWPIVNKRGAAGIRQRGCIASMQRDARHAAPLLSTNIHSRTMAHLIKAPHNSSSQASTPAVTRVLVVDDNKDAAVMLGLLLREMGHEVMATDKVMDGLVWAHKEHPQVVVLDLEMPGMDGYETCRLVRTSKWGTRATVVAVSGHSGPEDRARSKEAGFDYHLAKPIDRALLFSVLNVSAVDRAAGPQ